MNTQILGIKNAEISIHNFTVFIYAQLKDQPLDTLYQLGKAQTDKYSMLYYTLENSKSLIKVILFY